MYVLSQAQQCFCCINGYEFQLLQPSSDQIYTKIKKAGYM